MYEGTEVYKRNYKSRLVNNYGKFERNSPELSQDCFVIANMTVF